MIHLECHGDFWCEPQEKSIECTDDPRDATCVDCLRNAASYGAAAAMRCAAVEAGGARDNELARERDEAMRKLNMICADLEGRGAFFCTGCETMWGIGARALKVNDLSWCERCTAKRVTS